jgi:hypothetical protein
MWTQIDSCCLTVVHALKSTCLVIGTSTSWQLTRIIILPRYISGRKETATDGVLTCGNVRERDGEHEHLILLVYTRMSERKPEIRRIKGSRTWRITGSEECARARPWNGSCGGGDFAWGSQRQRGQWPPCVRCRCGEGASRQRARQAAYVGEDPDGGEHSAAKMRACEAGFSASAPKTSVRWWR